MICHDQDAEVNSTGDGPVSKNVGQDGDAADWSRGSVSHVAKGNLGWTQEHDYKNQET